MVSVVKLVENPVQIILNNGITFRGDYDESTTYATGDSVAYLGSSYVAIQETTGNLPTDTSFWQLLAEKGDAGVFSETFEFVSKNISSWNYVLNYISGDLTSIVYTDGSSTITKTLNYVSGDLASIVLSGDTPGGIDLTKTFNYTNENLSGVTYS